LLPPVDAHERPVHQGQEVGGQLRGQLHRCALVGTGRQHRPPEPRPVDFVLDVGGQPQAVGVAAADPGQPGQVQHAAGQPELQQRHHLQLVLPDRLVGPHPGKPHRLKGAAELIKGHPGLLAHLAISPRRAQRPPPVGGCLQEGERQSTCPDRRRDPVHGQPGLLAGLGQADLLHIAGEERGGAGPDHQDAEVDQPLDLGLGGAGEVGKSRCRDRIHAAAIL
jgi:hypothetical protein